MRSQGAGLQARADLRHALVGDARRRRVGVGIHAVGAGQDPLEGREAAGERLARLLAARPAVASAKRSRISSAAVRQSSSGPKTMKKSSFVAELQRACAAARGPGAGRGTAGSSAPESTIGGSSRQAMTRMRPESSSRNVVSGCVGCWASPATPATLTAKTLPPASSARRMKPRSTPAQMSETSNGSTRIESRRREAAAVQLVAQLQQVVLADALVVDELHRVAGARARP